MINIEQIAHDLTMVYLSNRFGVEVNGNISSYDYGDGLDVSGTIETKHLPSLDQARYTKVETGERGFLGIKKKKEVYAGQAVDSIFVDMVSEYFKAFKYFKMILNDIEIDDEGNIDPRSEGVAWFCDGCEDYLNDQEGFDWHFPTWKCTKCGFVNDLSENNIF